MNSKSINQFWKRARPYLQNGIGRFEFHGSRLLTTIRENFVPQRELSGIRAFGSRFVNLWNSGVYGKLAIVGGLLSCYMLFCLANSDGGLLVPQSGKYPKEWYDRCEEEPYGVIGFKGLAPAGRDKNGMLIFSSIPALSEVKEAFCVDALYGLRTYVLRDPSSVHYFPPASDRDGRISACKKFQEKMLAQEQRAKAWQAQRDFNNMMNDMWMESRMRDLEAEDRRLDIENKMQSIRDRQHDYDMSRASGMSLKQWDTYKRTPDAISLDKNGVYKGADGDMYQIDMDGNKWWLHGGNRVPVH